MKKLFSVSVAPTSLNISLFILRVGICVLMIPHGYDKLVHFAAMKASFPPFIGLSSTVSLSLSVFAEFFCAALVILGLFTRLALIPLVINMAVALYIAHGGDFFGKGQAAALFLLPFIVLLITGPGRYSVDGLINKK